MDREKDSAGLTGDGDVPVAGSRLDGGARFPAAAGGGDEPPTAAAGARLGPGPEFDLIRAFLARARPSGNPAIRVGPGDDCAVVEGSGIVLGTDLSIEDIHFRRTWLTPEEIGYRAAAAALSDLAAMAAKPIGLLVSLAAKPEDVQTVAAAVMEGVRAAIESLDGELLGGDLTRSPGPLVLDVVGVGETSRPMLRSGAAPGDEIWVTGQLGSAAAAVVAWRNGVDPESSARLAFASPRARVREALWLAERAIPRAMLDLSDGLAGDLAHLAAASGVGIRVRAGEVPVSAAARTAARLARAGAKRGSSGAPEEPDAQSTGSGQGSGASQTAGIDQALSLALTGGEDYELCFAAGSGTVEPHLQDFIDRFQLSLTRIGTVSPGSGVSLEMPDGRWIPLTGGFQHFGEAV